jgi:hypothetical protein
MAKSSVIKKPQDMAIDVPCGKFQKFYGLGGYLIPLHIAH